MSVPDSAPASQLHARRMGIDTYQEPVLYMHRDGPVCHSEGFEAQSRVEVTLGGRSVVATLNVVQGDLLALSDAGLSEAAWRALACNEGALVALRHPPPLESLGHVRAKAYGRKLTAGALRAVVTDVAAGRYSGLQLAAFVTACAGDRLDADETVALTRAMVDAGDRIEWGPGAIVDKHCIGGLPGNRTTMIVVPIAAACGLRIPKTSSCHHLAGRDRGHHGGAGTGRTGPGGDPPGRGAHGWLHRLGRLRAAQPG